MENENLSVELNNWSLKNPNYAFEENNPNESVLAYNTVDKNYPRLIIYYDENGHITLIEPA